MENSLLHLCNRNIGKIFCTILPLFFGLPAYYLFIGFVLGYEIDRLRWSDGDNPFDELKGLKRHNFIVTFFKLLGFISKSDGLVSHNEIQVAENFMQELKLDLAEINLAKNAFSAGKGDNFQLSYTLNTFYKKFTLNRGVREQFAKFIFQAAMAGDIITPEINDSLYAIAAQINIKRKTLDSIYDSINKKETIVRFRKKNANPDHKFKKQKTSHQRYTYTNTPQKAPTNLTKALVILGVSKADDDKSVKRAYRRLLNQNHPDKVSGRGSSEKDIHHAHEKTIRIRQAYELVKEHRGF